MVNPNTNTMTAAAAAYGIQANTERRGRSRNSLKTLERTVATSAAPTAPSLAVRRPIAAPVAIRDASAAYNVELNPPGRTGRASVVFTRRNIAKGELVSFRFKHLNGGGTYKLRVTYSQATSPTQVDPMGPNELTVGRKRITIP